MPKIKLIFLNLTLLFGGFFLYIFSILFGVTILLPLFVVAHMILTSLYIKKNYPRRLLLSVVILIIINFILVIAPFSLCESHDELGLAYSCDCKGLIKYKISSAFFEHQCIGLRTKCYSHIDESWPLNAPPRMPKTKIECNKIR